jgi:thiamine biosynthesis lipoprotein
MSAVTRPRPLASATWPALGTTALVRVDDPDALDAARAIVAGELAAIDTAASRFRADSELERVNATGGRFTRVSPLLHEAIAVALRAAALSDGAVDPTLGEAIRLAGYDRDFKALTEPTGAPGRSGEQATRRVMPAPRFTARRHAGWAHIQLSDDPPGVCVPAGMRLDLGATAKALAADRAVSAVAAATGAAALVSLGGDIATAGPVPPGGWLIHVTDDHRRGPKAPGQTVAISTGALATSSVLARRWRHGDRNMHHILDPTTGLPTGGPWRTVSVTAGTCVDANIASTAAIVLGESAPAWLDGHGMAARLVAHAGGVVTVGGWPEEPLAPHTGRARAPW